MELVIIGSGNVATVLGKTFFERGIHIRQVYSRNYANALALAGPLGAMATNDLSAIQTDADLYLMAVSDQAIAPIAAQLNVGDRLLLHTAGAVSKEVLSQASSNFGVLWPMKMVKKSQNGLADVQMMVDGSSKSVLAFLSNLARLVGGKVAFADDEERVKLHLMAVFCSNFSNHLYHLAADYCRRNNLDFGLLYSIINQTAAGIEGVDPSQSQAGPAFRGDYPTMDKHLQLLENEPVLSKFYQSFSESIQRIKKRE